MTSIEKFLETFAARFTTSMVPIVLIASFWTGCSDEQLFPGNARLKTSFRLTSDQALDGSITIQQAYLKLEGISVTGILSEETTPEANYPIDLQDPPYRLTQGDTAQISLTLPTGAYDQMDLHLFLLQTDYPLIVHQKTGAGAPPPVNDGTEDPNGVVTDPGQDNSDNGSTDDERPGTSDDGDANQDDPNEKDNNDDRNDDTTGEDKDDRDDENRHETDDGDDDKKNDDKKNKGKNKDKKKGKDKDDEKKGDDDRDDDDDDRDDEDDDRDDEDDDRDDDDRISGTQIDGTVDLDHFFEHAKPSLVVFATWTSNAESINIVFAATDIERITLRATQNDQSRIVVDEHGRATVNFDPERWFDSISLSDLQNAYLQTYQGQPVMFIHKEVNTGLFETILGNLSRSATFEVSPVPAQ